MSRIADCFQSLRRSRRRALITYFTAGDPRPDVTVPLMHVLVAAGADIIELGVPFSDPMADGPVIQRACERALSQGVSLRRTLTMVSAFRQRNERTPVVLMGYLNPIEAMGYLTFTQLAAQAGVDGVLTVDLPPEEAHELVELLDVAGIDPIFLLAPTSSRERIQRVVELARGYLYYVSLKGVTGSSTLNVADVGEKLNAIRALTDLPIGVGFGIKEAESAAAIARLADAVVVGSAIVSQIEEQAANWDTMQVEVAALVSSMRKAMDQASEN